MGGTLFFGLRLMVNRALIPGVSFYGGIDNRIIKPTAHGSIGGLIQRIKDQCT